MADGTARCGRYTVNVEIQRGSIPLSVASFIDNLIVIPLYFKINEGYKMAGRFIVREFKNGVKHFWDTDKGSCIHWSKVKDLIPEKEFRKLFKQFSSVKQPKKKNTTESFPKISDVLNEVVDAYSDKISIEEIIGALELCKTQVLTHQKTKTN